MKKANCTAALAIALAALAGQSLAADNSLAQADSVNGQVAIVRAGQTLPLTADEGLQPGDKLVAMENGKAQIRFADGCLVPLQSKSVATVGAQSPCAAGHLVSHSSPMDFAGADAWIAPLAIIGFAGAYALIVDNEKSKHQFTVAAPVSP